MSKIKKLPVLKYQQELIDCQPLLILGLMHSIILENEKAYHIIANQISPTQEHYTLISDLTKQKCFFAPNFGQKMMKLHFTKFPLKLGKNDDHASLMIEAIMHGANHLIGYLLSQGINPNIYDKFDQYPIAIATLHNNVEVVQMLINHGANVNLSKKGFPPAIAIANAIGAGDITLMLKKAGAARYKSSTKFTIPATLVPYNDGSIDKDIMQFKIFFLQAVFASENQDLFFQMTYKMFEKITNALASTPTNQHKKPQLSSIVSNGISILQMYQYNNDQVEFLEKRIEDIAGINSLHMKLFCLYAKKAANTAYFDPILSVGYAQKAYELLLKSNENEVDDKMLADALCNIALAMQSINPRAAIELLSKAEQYSPNNQKIINQEFGISLHAHATSELVIDVFTKYKNHPRSKEILTTFYSIFGGSAGMNAFDAKDDQSLKSLMLKFMLNKNIEKRKVLVLKFIEEFIQKQDDESYPIIDVVSTILAVIDSYSDFSQQSLSIISHLKSDYPNIFKHHKNPYLKYIEFCIYEANDLTEEANKIIDYFKEIYKLGDKLHYQYTLILKSRIQNILAQHGGEEEAKNFINELEDKNIAKMLFEYTSNLQEIKQQEAKHITPQKDLFVDNFDTSEVKNSNEVTDSPIINVSQEDEDIIATEVTIDHKQIHKFHQQLKMKVLPPLEPILPAKFGSYWLVNDKKYHTCQADVYLLELNKYGYIDQGTLGKLDSKLQTQFLQAIKKGKIGHFTNTTGVICFEGETVAKIKINADKRLYATEQYENQEGKKLIIFDRIGNHKELDKVTSHGPIKIEYVEGYTCDDSFIETNNAANIIGDIGLAELSI